MKKIIVSLCLIVVLFSGLLVSCDKPIKTFEDVNNLYNNMISEYNFLEGDVQQNKMFGSDEDGKGKTITIKYVDSIQEKIDSNLFTIDDELGLRYKALYVEQQLLNYIFSYYEIWSENFYVNSNDMCSQSEINQLYNLLNELKLELASFNESKINFENEIIDVYSVDDYHNSTITRFTYKYNNLIQKSLNFVGYFKSLHEHYYFNDKNIISVNSMNQLLSASYFNLAEFVYYENIKAFNFKMGDNGVCDLYYLLNAFAIDNNNEYVVFDELLNEVLPLNSALVTFLNDLELSETIRENMNNIKYYINSYFQNKEIYMKVYNQIDYNEIVKYRFGAIENPDINLYVTRFNTSQNSSYTFINNMLKFIFPKFIEVMEELVN